MITAGTEIPVKSYGIWTKTKGINPFRACYEIVSYLFSVFCVPCTRSSRTYFASEMGHRTKGGNTDHWSWLLCRHKTAVLSLPSLCSLNRDLSHGQRNYDLWYRDSRWRRINKQVPRGVLFQAIQCVVGLARDAEQCRQWRGRFCRWRQWFWCEESDSNQHHPLLMEVGVDDDDTASLSTRKWQVTQKVRRVMQNPPTKSSYGCIRS